LGLSRAIAAKNAQNFWIEWERNDNVRSVRCLRLHSACVLSRTPTWHGRQGPEATRPRAGS